MFVRDGDESERAGVDPLAEPAAHVGHQVEWQVVAVLERAVAETERVLGDP